MTAISVLKLLAALHFFSRFPNLLFMPLHRSVRMENCRDSNVPQFRPQEIASRLIITINGKRTLVLTDKGKVLRAIELAEIKVRDIEWANDAQVLVDYSQTENLDGFTADKAEFYRTFVIPVGANTPQVIFAKQKGIASATFGWHGIREVDGKTFGFFGGVPMEETAGPTGAKEYYFAGGWPALYKVDLSNMKTERLSVRPSEGTQHDYLIDAKGTLAAKLIFAQQSGNWRILNANSDEIARGVSKQGGVSLLAFGKGGASLIFRREDEDTWPDDFLKCP